MVFRLTNVNTDYVLMSFDGESNYCQVGVFGPVSRYSNDVENSGKYLMVVSTTGFYFSKYGVAIKGTDFGAGKDINIQSSVVYPRI